jgi:hypothetical protein
MPKIIRTKTKAHGGITERERGLMDKHAQLWIARAMRTDPIEADKIIPAIEGIYAAANLKKPRVAIVPSPLVIQGEVRVYKIDAIPADIESRPAEQTAAGDWIISHSESGHHHILPGGDADVIERVDNVPTGMRILYAIVRNPTALRQDAPVPHGEIPHDAGSIYEHRISREFDPFAEQVRRVAD